MYNDNLNLYKIDTMPYIFFKYFFLLTAPKDSVNTPSESQYQSSFMSLSQESCASKALCSNVFSHNQCCLNSSHSGVKMYRNGFIPKIDSAEIDEIKTNIFNKRIEYSCRVCKELFGVNGLKYFYDGFGKSKEKSGFVCENCDGTERFKKITKGYANRVSVADFFMSSEKQRIKGYYFCSGCKSYDPLPRLEDANNIYCLNCEKYFCNDCVKSDISIKRVSMENILQTAADELQVSDNDEIENECVAKKTKTKADGEIKQKISKDEHIRRIREGKALSATKKREAKQQLEEITAIYIQKIKDVLEEAGIDISVKTTGKYIISEEQKKILNLNLHELFTEFLSRIHMRSIMEDMTETVVNLEENGPNMFSKNITDFAKNALVVSRLIQRIKKESGLNMIIKAYTGKNAKGFSMRMQNEGCKDEEEDEMILKPCQKCKGTGSTGEKRKRGARFEKEGEDVMD